MTRPTPPRRRSGWRIPARRLRLLRFWVMEVHRLPRGDDTTVLLYLGSRDGGQTPLLVLGWLRMERPHIRGVEVTWYPGRGNPPRHPEARAIKFRPTVQVGRVQLWLIVVAWPRFMYSLLAGWERREGWR